MKKPTLVLLAAGMGSRYGGLKQLDKLGPSGETIMDYSVFDAIRAGFGKVVFVIRRDIEQPFREREPMPFQKCQRLLIMRPAHGRHLRQDLHPRTEDPLGKLQLQRESEF